MGGGRWSSKDWGTYSSTKISGKSKEEIFTSKTLDVSLDPKGANRESVDSKDNPESTALIVGLDVTGSMDIVLDAMARQGLNILASQIYERKPISDPHIMFMGIGDVEMRDKYPLQVTQFEADIRIAEQVQKIVLEGGGGGNHYESYALAWLFAGAHTKIDCFDKRKKKGYLFTVGDEEPTPYLKAQDIEKVIGDKVQDMDVQALLTMASRQYEVFHVMVEEGSHFRSSGPEVAKKWVALLGQRALRLSDHTKLAEVIVSAIQVNEGISKKKVMDSWKEEATSSVVDRAIKNLSKPKSAVASL
jgi:hypothetical protein